MNIIWFLRLRNRIFASVEQGMMLALSEWTLKQVPEVRKDFYLEFWQE